MRNALIAALICFKIVVASGGLNVRSEPCISGLHRYTLENRQVVAVLEEQDGWALVALNNSPDIPVGWACMDYLK